MTIPPSPDFDMTDANLEALSELQGYYNPPEVFEIGDWTVEVRSAKEEYEAV